MRPPPAHHAHMLGITSTVSSALLRMLLCVRADLSGCWGIDSRYLTPVGPFPNCGDARLCYQLVVMLVVNAVGSCVPSSLVRPQSPACCHQSLSHPARIPPVPGFVAVGAGPAPTLAWQQGHTLLPALSDPLETW